MSKRHKPLLGRGLDSLLGGASELAQGLAPEHNDGTQSIANISIELLTPNRNQPRREFDDERIGELAESIKHIGLVQPITVQPQSNGRYLIISGERRYRAALLAGLESLPAYVRQANADEVLEMALVENIQREDLNAIEVALAYQQLAETLSLTHEALAERVGKKRATVTNYLRLLRLPAQIQLGISQRLLEMGHAKALLQVDDTERQIELYQLIVQEKLSVREVEELARAIREGKPKASANPTNRGRTTLPREYHTLEKHLGQVFETKVSLRYSSKGKGSINIPFSKEEDLERIIQLLERIQK